MTFRHLKIFMSVYQEENITRASKKLHLAQPSVSLAIKELEDAYGILLFDRINRRLFVTEKGIEFYKYANRIVSLFDEMETKVSSSYIQEHIHIGSSVTIGNYIVPDVLCEFAHQYPTCDVQVTIQNSQSVIQAVLKNEQDFGLVEDKVSCSQLEEISFMKDELFFVCAINHPLVQEKDVTLEKICEFPFLMREQGSASREITDTVMKDNHLKYRILWESISSQALIRGVINGQGITVLSGKIVEESLKEKQVVVLPIHPVVFKRSFTLIYHRKKYLSETIKYLMECFQRSYN